MSKLWDVMEMALGDAGRAEMLFGDPHTRRALRNDPERTLQVFELRDLAVVAARRQAAAGTRLPA